MAAGTTYTKLYLDNGQVISVLVATSAAVGVVPVVNMEGTATAGGNTDFTVRSKCKVIDQTNVIGTCATCSVGQMEVYNVTRSLRTGRYLEQGTPGYDVTAADRLVPSLGFAPGNVYRFIQTIAQVSA